jgi:hypothetical protein
MSQSYKINNHYCYSIPSPSPFPSPIKEEGSFKVSLQLFEFSERLIKTLVNEQKKSGDYFINLNTRTFSADTYFLSLETEEKRIIERLIAVI